MSCSFSPQIPKALPSLSPSPPPPYCRKLPLFITYNQKTNPNTKFESKIGSTSRRVNGFFDVKKTSLAIQVGALLATFEKPALAVTGVNNEQDFVTAVIELGIVAVWYFLIMPPIIMNWLRIRWYRRKLLEMYLQFMCVFIFFPGLLLWAPFLNFRKFPRDPSMEYPWDTPKDPSKIKNAYLKYPWAAPEDYD
ncbi:hypothetical protein SLE2022_154660 [Rubroshorea leprosula]